MAGDKDILGRDSAIDLLRQVLSSLDSQGEHLAAAYVEKAIEELIASHPNT